MKTMPHKFGMFVHFGIYSLSEYHEQYRWRKNISRAEYAKFAEIFNPTEYNPDEWVSLAKNAGMEYICVTTKHHDGFCMWNTAYSDFKITNTPYGKDFLKELSEACRRQGIALSLYYSIPDWNHKNAYNPKSSHQIKPDEGDEPDTEKYREYVKNQLTELLTNYGEIYTLFWDIPPQIEDTSINKLARKLQPNIIINDRGYDSGDFSTPERYVPDGQAFERYTEACQAVGRESWGYRRKEDYHSIKYIEQSIDKIMVMGGSYLLNVGPMPSGKIDERSAKIIKTVGDWYNRIKESVTDVEIAADILNDKRNAVTKKGDTLYIHMYHDPETSGLTLKPIDYAAKKVTVLNTGKELYFDVDTMPDDFNWSLQELNPPSLHIYDIPVDELIGEVIVLKVEF